MPKYFDIHSHLNLKDYDQDLDEVIGRLKETQTHTIVVGVDFETSKKAVELADKHREIYACIGLHPIDSLESFEVDKFNKLISNPKVVAVGECGLDFYHAKKSEDFDRQKKLFLEQIEFAIAHNKPLMIHARDAYHEILEILKDFKGRVRGNVHFFAGDWQTAQKFFELDFTVSFTGVITFVRDYDEIIKFAPLDKILSETDAPFVAPAPYRGQRNEPSYVQEVVKCIAELRGADFEEVRQALVENALRMVM